MIVDAHCHASPVWFEPVEPLVFQMDQNGVDFAVLTQALGQFDNEYQEGCLERFPGRFASVIGASPADPEAAAKVRACAERGAVGVRLRPEGRSAGDDPLAIWRAAADKGMVISCGGTSANNLSDDFADLVRTFPDMIFVLEHLGGWTRPDCDKTDATREGIMRLSDFSNIQIKVPALGQLSPRKMPSPLPASGCVLDPEPGKIVLDILKNFGSDRMMWGSDYPPVSSREGYANSLNWTRELFVGCDQADIANIFGFTAARTFALGK